MSAKEHRDILQAEIAAAVGVTTTALSRWEREERVPRENDIAKLAKFYGVTPAFLRYGVDVQLPPMMQGGTIADELAKQGRAPTAKKRRA